VQDFHHKTRVYELKQHFHQFGDVVEIVLVGKRAFITFDRKKDAVEAARDGNGGLLAGKRLRVTVVDAKARPAGFGLRWHRDDALRKKESMREDMERRQKWQEERRERERGRRQWQKEREDRRHGGSRGRSRSRERRDSFDGGRESSRYGRDRSRSPRSSSRDRDQRDPRRGSYSRERERGRVDDFGRDTRDDAARRGRGGNGGAAAEEDDRRHRR